MSTILQGWGPSFVRYFTVICLLAVQAALGADRLSPRYVSELGNVRKERGYRVRKAWVSFIDKEGLATDHPEAAEAIKAGKIKSWEDFVLSRGAVMSASQLSLEGFNTLIEVDLASPVDLYRGNEDGRGGTIEISVGGKPDGLANLKGIGNPDKPTTLNGLLTHTAAIAETDRQRAVQFNATMMNMNYEQNYDYQTVPVRAIIVLDVEATEKESRSRVAIEWRQAFARADTDIFGFLPDELGIATYLNGHQASRSGALVDFGLTPVTHPDLGEKGNGKENLKAAIGAGNDLVHEEAAKAADAWEKGDKTAVQKLLDRPEWTTDLAVAVTRGYENAFAEDFNAHGGRPPGLPQDEWVLRVYLATPFETLERQLQFTLAAYYQRHPEAFERAVEIMQEVVEAEHDEQRASSWFRWPRKHTETLEARLNNDQTGFGKGIPSISRSLDLIKRAILGRDIYPFGARYWYSSSKIPNLHEALRIPENGFLFLKNATYHRLVQVAQSHDDDPNRKQEVSFDTEMAHAMDHLLGELPEEIEVKHANDTYGFNMAEQLRRINLLFDKVGDPPITANSFLRAMKLGQRRKQAEALLAISSEWSENMGANNRLGLGRELSLLAFRLGSMDHKVLETIQEMAQTRDRDRAKSALEARGKYLEGVRFILMEAMAHVTLMTYASQNMRAAGLADFAESVEQQREFRVHLGKAIRETWPEALPDEDVPKFEFGNPEVKPVTLKLGEGLRYSVKYRLGPGEWHEGEFLFVLGSDPKAPLSRAAVVSKDCVSYLSGLSPGSLWNRVRGFFLR